MDLSQLSDAELDAYIAVAPVPPSAQTPAVGPQSGAVRPLSEWSDAELNSYIAMGRGTAFLHGATKGMSANFGDEIAGVQAAAGPSYTGNAMTRKFPIIGDMMAGAAKLGAEYFKGGDKGPATQAYEGKRDAVRTAEAQAQQQYPGTTFTGELAGAVSSPIGAVARGVSPVVGGMRAGATYGGLSGLGEGTTPDERLIKGVGGMLFGAPAGALGGKIAEKLTPAAKVPAPTVGGLKSAAEAGYESPAIADLALKPSAMKDWASTLVSDLNREGFDELLAPKTFGLLGKLTSAPVDAVVTGNNLNTVRKMFGKAAGSPDATERAAASKVISELDDFSGKIPAAQVISGDAEKAAAALTEARGNWAAAKRSETVDRKITQAELRADASNSGMNVANTIRQRVADILIDPAKQRGYSKAELSAMEQIVKGSKSGNTLRFVGNLLGGGGGLGAVTSAAVGGFATGGPGAVAPVVGFGLKSLSNSLTLRQADKLSELIRSNSPLGKQMAGPLADWAKAGELFRSNPSPQTIAKASRAASNLSQNLKDAGISISAMDILRSLQAPATGRADQDQP